MGKRQVTNIHVIIIPKAGEGTEKIAEETIAEKFTTVMKTINEKHEENYPKAYHYQLLKTKHKKESLKSSSQRKKYMSHTQEQRENDSRFLVRNKQDNNKATSLK